MNVTKVSVERLPKDCSSCRFYNEMYEHCNLTEQDISFSACRLADQLDNTMLWNGNEWMSTIYRLVETEGPMHALIKLSDTIAAALQDLLPVLNDPTTQYDAVLAIRPLVGSEKTAEELAFEKYLLLEVSDMKQVPLVYWPLIENAIRWRIDWLRIADKDEEAIALYKEMCRHIPGTSLTHEHVYGGITIYHGTMYVEDGTLPIYGDWLYRADTAKWNIKGTTYLRNQVSLTPAPPPPVEEPEAEPNPEPNPDDVDDLEDYLDEETTQ